MNRQNQTPGAKPASVRRAILFLLLSGCASIAISAAKPKQASPTQSEQSKAANDAFWRALHAGAYEEIPDVKERLQQAYLADPFDAPTAAHLGFLHIWAISERDRLPNQCASITDQMVLSQRYFGEAVEMTGDARFQGFLALTELANGSVHKDERLLRTGFFRLADSVDAYPEFNLFSRGLVLGGFPHDSDRFKDGVEDMWRAIDLCIEGKIDRHNPDYTALMKHETTTGPRRVCWNGWIAPHNHEGFSLTMGDMLVKQGEVKAARRMYENAKLSRTYEKWPYREVLDQRIAQADENVAIFRLPAAEQPKGRRTLIASEYSCSACHADNP